MPELPDVETFKRYLDATSLRQRISGVDVFCGRRLRKYLRREAAGRSGYLDDRQIEAIHDIAAQVLPPAH